MKLKPSPKSHENRESLFITALMNLAESDQPNNIDIKKHFNELQKLSAPDATDSKNVICDICEDHEALHQVASTIYYQIKFDALRNSITRTQRRLELKKEELSLHVWDKYKLEDHSAFFIDYRGLCIRTGVSQEQRQKIEKILEFVKKIIRYPSEQISILYANLDESDNQFEKDLVELINGTEGDNVRSTIENLFLMDKKELKAFRKDEERLLVSYIARLIHDIKPNNQE
jgi:hypothetical protein